MLPPTTVPSNSINNGGAKPLSSGQFERGNVRLIAKYPAHNNYFCSYEIAIDTEIFKPDPGRTAMIYFTADQTLERHNYDYGRFCFYLPKSIQPVFDELLTNKSSLHLTVQIAMDGNRPAKDQAEAVFRLQSREQLK
ncbi:MAG: hypothetical protein LBD01_07285 [Puniceicoccales bacterium]|jgi:hypothetical protein|nr:hypothetical protein [Puniceicoccales bacterium]